MGEEHVVTVFADGPGGGNPAPVVLDADGWSDADMQALARRTGHESAFVLKPPDGCDFALRFWVPRHEMTMCGHATVGVTWLLHELGRLPAGEATVATASGRVRARVRPGGAEVSQPAGRVRPLPDADVAAVLAVLGLVPAQLAARPVVNAATSRTKTLVPIADPAVLDALTPDWDRVEDVCARIDSTGLYPYALAGDGPVADARQFPRGAGYPEDPATGVAAAALAYGLLAEGVLSGAGPALTVRQGRAMGRPSRITVRLAADGSGCWVGGAVQR